MCLPQDHRCAPDGCRRRGDSRLALASERAWRSTFRGERPAPIDVTAARRRSAFECHGRVALTSIALAILLEALLGTSISAPLLCLLVVVSIGWRTRCTGRLLIATVVVAVNSLILPSVLLRNSPGSHAWAWLSLWCLEGLLINWLLIQLGKDLQGHLLPEGTPTASAGFSPEDESTLHVLIESSRQSHEQLRLMIESIGNYAIIMLTPDGRVASWNVGAERILGYRAAEILGRHHSEFYVAEEVLLRAPDRHIEMSKENGTYEAEGWRRRKDDSRLWVFAGFSTMRSPSGSLLGYATVIRDMTEKRQAEESLRQAHDELESRVRIRTAELAAANDALHAEVSERIQAEKVLQQQSLVLRSILDSIGDAVIVAEGEETPLTFNAAARALFGIGDGSMALEEWLSQDLYRTVDASSSSVTMPLEDRPLTRALRGEQVDDLELLVQSPRSATATCVLANARALRHSSGEGKGAVIAFRDITERRRAAEELRVAKEAAESASRAKDQFLAVLSHELRTPLTPILLAASHLHRDDASAEIQSGLAMIHRNAMLEARLIDDLLDLTRASTGRLSLSLATTDVHRVIQHAAEVCRAEVADSGLKLKLHFYAHSHTLQGDPTRLQQVFWNLIKNAVKFTPRGGTITIRTWNPSGKSTEDVPFMAEVSDTGIGIDADRLPRIFHAFEQKAPDQQKRYGGLGLGLAISRSVIEAHGGRLSAFSAGENRGAAFTIELAALPSPAISVVADDGPQAHLDSFGGPVNLRILLIEDNRDTLNYLASILQQRGYQVNQAASFRTARSLAESNIYDLVISDIELPDGSGLDLIRELSTRRPTPGIALSGFGTADDIAMSLQAGFTEHLIKPIDVRKLDEAIHRVVRAGIRGQNEDTHAHVPLRCNNDRCCAGLCPGGPCEFAL